jgi:hypothetical protein
MVVLSFRYLVEKEFQLHSRSPFVAHKMKMLTRDFIRLNGTNLQPRPFFVEATPIIMASSNGNRRRNAFTAKDLLGQLPAAARAKHNVTDHRASENQHESKAAAKLQLIEPTRRTHVRHDAFTWTAFSEAVACITPTKPFDPRASSELSPPHAPSLNRNVDPLEVNIIDRIASPSTNELLDHSNRDLSSLEYSSSDDSYTGSVPEDIELAIAKSVGAVELDFSIIKKTFQCAVCLETPGSDDAIASISCCDHNFCFEVSVIYLLYPKIFDECLLLIICQCIVSWASKNQTCHLCKQEFHLVASRRKVRWY